MDFLDAFQDEMNQSALIYKQTKVYNSSTGKYTPGYSLQKTVSCAFWKGRQAEQLVAERFKTIIDGVVIIKPASLDSYVILPSDKINVNSIDYAVIDADDVLLQEEALVVGVKEFS